MMTSASISAHDLLTDHPFRDIQLISTPTDHHHDHGGQYYYCHNWVSQHHHQLDQQEEQVGFGSDDEPNNQVMDIWKREMKHGLGNIKMTFTIQRPGPTDMDVEIHDNWVPNSSNLRVVKKMKPKRALTSNSVPVVEISSSDDFHFFQPENDSSSNRVCSDCNTTRTPLWRSGPRGPKSLCNACGIRQRKARKALAAAGSDNSAVTKVTSGNPKSPKIKTNNTCKEKKTCITSHDDNNQGWQQPYKKRRRHVESQSTSASKDSNPCSENKGICFEEFITVSLSKNTALHRVFPQDEKEAAILLMALSWGLVHN